MANTKQLKTMLTQLGYSGDLLDKNLEAILSIGGGGSGGGTTYTFKAPLGVSASNEVSINLAGYVTTTTLNSALGNYTQTNLLGNEFRNAVESNTSLQNAIKDVALPSIKAGTNVNVNYNNTTKELTIDATGGGDSPTFDTNYFTVNNSDVTFSQNFLNTILQYKDTTATDFNDPSLDGAIYSLSQGQSNTMLNSPSGSMPMAFFSFINKTDTTQNFFGYHVAIGKTTNTQKTNVFVRAISNTAGINGDTATRQHGDWERLLPESEVPEAVTNAINDPANTDLIQALQDATSGGGGGSSSGGMPSSQAFIFRERLSNVNWTINAGSNAFFNFTQQFATQGVVDQDTNFLTGANPYFIYDSATQSFKMRANIVNEHLEFLVSGRFNYNGNSGSEFAFVIGRPSTSSNTSTGIIETAVRTQGQNVQTTQTRKNGLNIHTRLLSTADGSDPYQTEGFKLGFFNYSTNTSITITEATLTVVLLNRIKF